MSPRHVLELAFVGLNVSAASACGGGGSPDAGQDITMMDAVVDQGVMSDANDTSDASGPSAIVQLAGGSFGVTAVVRGDGTVWAWGIDDYGQLGMMPSMAPASCTVNGTTSPCALTPVQVPNVSNVRQLAMGNGHLCALLMDGSVECWGLNETGQLGLGTADTAGHAAAMHVTLQAPTRFIAAGSFHTCAVLTDDTVWCWGANNYGQVGVSTSPGPNMCTETDGTVIPCANSPTQVVGLHGVAQLALGRFHSCALGTDGTVSCWGLNDSGQLGVGTPDDQPHETPQMLALTNVRSIAAGGGSHTCAVMMDGTARCWGWADIGQLGISMADTQNCMVAGTGFGCAPMPAMVVGITAASQLTTGRMHTCGMLNTGDVYCWGRNDDGEVGVLNSPDSCSNPPDTYPCNKLPAQVMSLQNALEVAAGEFHSCARFANEVRCWGRNDFGQLGDGTTTARSMPVIVHGL